MYVFNFRLWLEEQISLIQLHFFVRCFRRRQGPGSPHQLPREPEEQLELLLQVRRANKAGGKHLSMKFFCSFSIQFEKQLFHGQPFSAKDLPYWFD